MKKTLIALSVATLGFAATAQAAVEASAVATWQATAKKDTTSELVVTPLTITIVGSNDAPTVQPSQLSVSEDDVAAM